MKSAATKTIAEATGFARDELSLDLENVLNRAIDMGADLAPILARTYRGLDGMVYMTFD